MCLLKPQMRQELRRARNESSLLWVVLGVSLLFIITGLGSLSQLVLLAACGRERERKKKTTLGQLAPFHKTF